MVKRIKFNSSINSPTNRVTGTMINFSHIYLCFLFWFRDHNKQQKLQTTKSNKLNRTNLPREQPLSMEKMGGHPGDYHVEDLGELLVILVASRSPLASHFTIIICCIYTPYRVGHSPVYHCSCTVALRTIAREIREKLASSEKNSSDTLCILLPLIFNLLSRARKLPVRHRN